MDKTTIFVIITVIKAIAIIVGMIYIFLNIMSWRNTKDNSKLKKAVFTFGGIFLSILLLTAIEFAIA
jgi:hypothetical protein